MFISFCKKPNMPQILAMPTPQRILSMMEVQNQKDNIRRLFLQLSIQEKQCQAGFESSNTFSGPLNLDLIILLSILTFLERVLG